MLALYCLFTNTFYSQSSLKQAACSGWCRWSAVSGLPVSGKTQGVERERKESTGERCRLVPSRHSLVFMLARALGKGDAPWTDWLKSSHRSSREYCEHKEATGYESVRGAQESHDFV